MNPWSRSTRCLLGLHETAKRRGWWWCWGEGGGSWTREKNRWMQLMNLIGNARKKLEGKHATFNVYNPGDSSISSSLGSRWERETPFSVDYSYFRIWLVGLDRTVYCGTVFRLTSAYARLHANVLSSCHRPRLHSHTHTRTHGDRIRYLYTFGCFPIS